MMTIRQTHAKGDFVDTLLQVVALDDVVGLVAYSIAISIALASMTGNFQAQNVLRPIIMNLFAFALGGVFGLIFEVSSSQAINPSGNDAAYVVADYCGSILSPQAKNSQERINVFMEHLNNYLQNQGYENTILYDPSGYDVNALTTVSDLKSVSTHLLEKQWFRDIVSKSNYTATLPDGSTQTWRNTNTFLDQTSEYYNENVKGIKTGSLSNDYNLVVLYQQHGKEFLICSLGSQSDSSRYDDVNYILKTIDESDYLTK